MGWRGAGRGARVWGHTKETEESGDPKGTEGARTKPGDAAVEGGEPCGAGRVRVGTPGHLRTAPPSDVRRLSGFPDLEEKGGKGKIKSGASRATWLGDAGAQVPADWARLPPRAGLGIHTRGGWVPRGMETRKKIGDPVHRPPPFHGPDTPSPSTLARHPFVPMFSGIPGACYPEFDF